MGVDRLSLLDIRINPSMVPNAASDPAAALCSAVSNVPPGRHGTDEDRDERSEVLPYEGKQKKMGIVKPGGEKH